MRMLIVVFIATLLSGCAHKFMRGTVAMKVDASTAHVCLGDDDGKGGEKLYFYQSVCEGYGGAREGGDYGSCELKTLGTGSVTKILNSHYSEVKTNGSFSFSEGTLVQKRKL